MELLLLILFAFLAGFVDSIAGGGGLIQLPAFFVLFPMLSPAMALGTNKFAAFLGTTVAALRYVRNTTIPWNAVMPAIITALIFSVMGARVVSYLDKEAVRPIILLLLIIVAIYTFMKKDFGLNHAPTLNRTRTLIFSLGAGAVLGFYDGFFGPGTGSFLMVIFISLFGFSFLKASASAKLINCATNIAALVYFMYDGNVNYQLAIPVAAANMTGSFIGARMAIRRGSGFIRILFLLIVTGMIVKFTYDLLK